MVKISEEQPKSLSSSGKRVSFDAVSKTGGSGDYVEELLSLSEKSAFNNIERLLKVAQTLNSRRDCAVDGGLQDITNNIAYPRGVCGEAAAPRGGATEGSCCCCCPDHRPRQNERTTELHRLQEDTARHPSNSSLKTNSAKQQQQHPQPDCLAIAAVGATRDDDSPLSFAAAKAADPSRTGPDGGGGGGESPSLCRGYSAQRRHGRKASLGTTEIKRLIPTLVSENEEFRYKEYRRKSSASSTDDAQNLTI